MGGGRHQVIQERPPHKLGLSLDLGDQRCLDHIDLPHRPRRAVRQDAQWRPFAELLEYFIAHIQAAFFLIGVTDAETAGGCSSNMSVCASSRYRIITFMRC